MREREESRPVTAYMQLKFSERLSDPVVPPSLPDALVELLNGSKLSGPSTERVRHIIQILQARQEYMPRLMRGEFCEQKHFEPLVKALLGDALELNALLGRYRMFPQIDPIGVYPTIYYFPQNASDEEAEHTAVMGVLELAKRDELDRVKHCSCDRFFVPGRIDQRHCSTACRVKEHQSSEEFKAKRRKADRERYRLHKRGAVKQSERRKNGTQKTR
jgi:hypothetical protein